jgi:hypothetical protein
MKTPPVDRYFLSSLALVALSVLFLVIITLTDRKDISSGMVIICATVLFLTGILIFTFSKPESLDNQYVSLLSVQGTVNLCQVAADLGIAGSACLLPVSLTGHRGVMQFMPVTDYSGGGLTGDSFVSGPGGTGILVPHSGETLLNHLKKKNMVYIPDNRKDLSLLIGEIAEEILEAAESVRVSWSEDSVSIEVDGYCLADGCREISRLSPACCSMNPCPFCGMVAACITEGLDRPVRIDRCTPDLKNDDVHLRFTLL